MQKLILFSIWLMISYHANAQFDTASFEQNYAISIKSEEVSLNNSNTACISIKIKFYDTTYWDNIVSLKHQVYEYDRTWQGDLNKTNTDWWGAGSSSTPAQGFYFDGDSIQLALCFNYNSNYLPFSYRALRIEIGDGDDNLNVEKTFVYFTPYNTLEIWSYDDFLDLKRTWDSPEEGLLTSNRDNNIHPDSIPTSNISDEEFANDSFEYQYFSLPGLGYSVLMKDMPDPDEHTIMNGATRFKSDNCGVNKQRYKGIITGSIKAWLNTNSQFNKISDVPIEGIRVVLYDRDYGWNRDDLLGSAYTNKDGHYSIEVDVCQNFTGINQPEGDDLELYLEVIAIHLGPNIKVRNRIGAAIRGTCLRSNPIIWSYSNGNANDANLGVVHPGKENTKLHLLHYAYQCMDFVNTNIPDLNLGSAGKELVIMRIPFNSGPSIKHNEIWHKSGAFMLPGAVSSKIIDGTILLSSFLGPVAKTIANLTIRTLFTDKDGIYRDFSDDENEGTPYHEFGHYVMWHLQNRSFNLQIAFAEHRLDFNDNTERLAWTEGWAEGFSQIMDIVTRNQDKEAGMDSWWLNYEDRRHSDGANMLNPEKLLNTVRRSGNKTVEKTVTHGIVSEFNIACLMVDLFDGPETPNLINTNLVFNDNGNWTSSKLDDVNLTFYQICEPLIYNKPSDNISFPFISNKVLQNVYDYAESLISLSDCDLKPNVKQVFNENRISNFESPQGNLVNSDDIFISTTIDFPTFKIAKSNKFLIFNETKSVNVKADVSIINTGNTFNYLGSKSSYTMSDELTIDGGTLSVNNNWSSPVTIPGIPPVLEIRPQTIFLNVCNGKLTIQNNGIFRIGDATNSGMGIVQVNKGTSLFFSSPINPGKLIIHNNSKLVIEEGATLVISPNTQIILDGPNAVLEIKGNLELKDNAIFAPIGGANGLGYVKFNTAIFDAATAQARMKLGNNSRMTFNGINGAKVLEVESNTLWLDEQNNSFTFELLHGKAEMGQNATINIAGTAIFDHAFVDVSPTATQYNGVYIWYKNPTVQFSSFKHGKNGLATYTWMNKTIKSNNNFFIENNTGWFNMGAGVEIINNHFTDNSNNGLIATGQLLNSKFYTSTVTNVSLNGILYQGANTSGLTIRNSFLNFNVNGVVFESNADLIVGCTKITGVPVGLSTNGIVMKNGRLILNNLGGLAAGKNDITNQLTSVLLIDKPYIYLNDGYNRLSNKVLASSLMLSLSGKTAFKSSTITAHRNRWNEKTTGANIPVNGNLPWPIGTFLDYQLQYRFSKYFLANLEVIDNAALSLSAYIAATSDCTNPPVDYDPSVGNTSIIINTSRYPNTPITTAIDDVMNRNNDSLVPKNDIVNRYHEILVYDGYELPINAELAYYLELATDHLAIALGDWAAEQPEFQIGCIVQIPFQEVLGVCNFWLDATLLDTGYAGVQLSNKAAIVKGHALMLAKENALAQSQFYDLTTWGDSNYMEQASFWLCQIDRQNVLTSNRANFFLADSLTPCNYSYNPGNQYKRNITENKSISKINFNLYPNPVKNTLYVGIQSETELNKIEIKLIDMLGNILKEQMVSNTKAGYTKIEIPVNAIAKGTYFVQIKSGDKIENKKVIIIE